MAFIPLPNGIKIELNAVQNNVPIVNVWHAVLASAPTSTDLEDVAFQMETWWHDYVRDIQHPSYVVQNVTVTDVSVENGQQFINSAIFEPAGDGPGAPAAANAAAVISWRTPNTGRSFRGRTYIGGLVTASFLDAQHLTSADTSYLALAAQNLIDMLESVGAILVVCSKFALGVARVVALGTTVTTWIVDNLVDSQRRRTSN